MILFWQFRCVSPKPSEYEMVEDTMVFRDNYLISSFFTNVNLLLLLLLRIEQNSP